MYSRCGHASWLKLSKLAGHVCNSCQREKTKAAILSDHLQLIMATNMLLSMQVVESCGAHFMAYANETKALLLLAERCYVCCCCCYFVDHTSMIFDQLQLP